MKRQVFNLEPHEIKQNSFYGKAKVIIETVDNKTVSKLQSYSTIVAEYYHEENKMIVNGWYSNTTARHINSFLVFYGFDKCNKKQMENYQQ